MSSRFESHPAVFYRSQLIRLNLFGVYWRNRLPIFIPYILIVISKPDSREPHPYQSPLTISESDTAYGISFKGTTNLSVVKGGLLKVMLNLAKPAETILMRSVKTSTSSYACLWTLARGGGHQETRVEEDITVWWVGGFGGGGGGAWKTLGCRRGVGPGLDSLQTTASAQRTFHIAL